MTAGSGIIHQEMPKGQKNGLMWGFQLWANLPERAERVLVRGQTSAVLKAMAEEHPGTLLVLGAQGRGWMDRLLIGSTTESLLSALPSSLAVIPSRTVANTLQRREERPSHAGAV